MPLSEEELRLLEQMERALAAEDPKFVSTLRGRSLRHSARMRTVLAGVAFLAGVALLLGGAMANLWWLGVVGFLVMLCSAVIGLAAWHGQHAPAESAPGTDALFDFDDHPHRFDVIEGGRSSRRSRGTKKKGSAKRGTFMQRMEQRWEHRRGQGF